MRRDCRVAPSWQEPEKREAIEVQLRLITPMFGGGFKSREVDSLMPIRPAAIRGHLRFWWRATAGAQYANAAELYKAETAIWGGANEKGEPVMGKIAIQVRRREKQVSIKPWAQYEKDKDGVYKAMPKLVGGLPPYALFPFRGELNKEKTEIVEPPASYLDPIKFTLTLINCGLGEDQWKEALCALWAWIHLGGVGARTRRGCGSLQALSARLYEKDSWNDVNIYYFPEIPHLRALPAALNEHRLETTLQGSYYIIGQACTNPYDAWEHAVNIYRDFRQSVPFAREPSQYKKDRKGNPLPGRSKWPEPDTIRRLANTHHVRHIPKHPVNGFPRANLGLPIIFHFIDIGDPEDSTLQRDEERRMRFASPVITKPIPIGSNEFAPLILLLRSPDVWEGTETGKNRKLVLKFKNGLEKTINSAQIELLQERTQISPMQGKDIRASLMDYVQNTWKQSWKSV